MSDEAKEPLLLDEFGGHHEGSKRPWWQLPRLPILPKWLSRTPLLIAVGVLFFLLGVGVRGSPFKTKIGPDLALAIRIRVLNSLVRERYPVTGSQYARHGNYAALDRLANCLEAGTCGEGERTVILLASYHFGQAEAGGTGGEDVWARSTITSLHSLNYTILFAWGHMDALFFYQSIPDLIPVVLWEEGEFKHCSMRNETNYAELEKMENHALGTWQTGTKACMQTDKYLQGIPWWKSFVFLFWDSRPNPLGPQWTLSPEDWDSFSGAPRNHTFLGYSIEQRCQAVEFRSKRIHRALVLAKDPDYLNEKNNVFYGLLLDAAKTLPHEMTQEGNKEFELLSTAGEHALSELPEPGLSSIGKQPQKEWHDILAESKVLLGVGNPVISPSPYYALCLGVPFINPIINWHEGEPDNRRYWHTQQNALKFVEEPYVYHVRKGDFEGLKSALYNAAYNPIKRYIVPKMRRLAVTERHREFIERDWLSEAKAAVAQMENPEQSAFLAMDPPKLDLKGPPH